MTYYYLLLVIVIITVKKFNIKVIMVSIGLLLHEIGHLVYITDYDLYTPLVVFVLMEDPFVV
jgi:hypothetical protein